MATRPPCPSWLAGEPGGPALRMMAIPKYLQQRKAIISCFEKREIPTEIEDLVNGLDSFR